MSFSIVERILNAHRGATFVKADLHIHTPGSNDWDTHNPEPQYKAANIQPSDIVNAALAKDLRLIAITDHNSVEWCERVIQAAQGTELTVLPGFELTVRPGVHVLSIFEANKSIDELRGLLNRLLGCDDFGNLDAMTEDTIENVSSGFKVIKQLLDSGGFVIPSHIDLDSGLIGRLRGGTAVKDFLDKSGCNTLEINSSVPTVVETILRSDPQKFALIKNSDAHRLDQIGRHTIWFKMDNPSLNGLKQISVEPLTRIQTGALNLTPKPRILGMYSNGGLLAEHVFALNQDLNCLIGGRGAGKSAVIDYLRFAFGDEPIDPDLVNKFRKRLVDLVRESTSVYVLVSDSEDKLWLYERKLSYEITGRGSRTLYEITPEDANVYQVFVDQKRIVRFEEDSPSFRVQFYGQGEVQSITNTAEPERQLQLVDNVINTSIEPRKLKVDSLQSTLNTIDSEIIRIADNLETLQGEVGLDESLKARISEIEADLQDAHLQSHQVWEDANNWIVKALEYLETQKNTIDNITIDEIEEKDFSLDNDEAHTILMNILGETTRIGKLLQERSSAIKSEVCDLYNSIVQTKKQWDVKYTEEETRYTAMLRKQGVENLAALNRELASKKQALHEIENVKKPKIQEFEQQLMTLKRDRSKKLKELYQTWTGIRDCRLQAAKVMTRRLDGDVVIKITDELNLNDYYEVLNRCVPTIQNRQNQLQKVIQSFQPDKLVGLIRAGNTDELCEVSGITTNTAAKLLQMKECDVLEIERTYCDDIAEIKLIVEGVEKSLEDLSDGEQCTAILSVILLEEASPLIIDQPEDELDHAFIMSNVVSTLSCIKQKSNPLDSNFVAQKGRQFVIATHNQNIPVLGDAELVFKMRKVSGTNKCEPESAYGLEHHDTIQHILSLEGGRDAFERRRKKYEQCA